MVEIVEAITEASIGAAKVLFREYAASLDFNLCFQNFDRELAHLPKQYSAKAVLGQSSTRRRRVVYTLPVWKALPLGASHIDTWKRVSAR